MHNQGTFEVAGLVPLSLFGAKWDQSTDVNWLGSWWAMLPEMIKFLRG
ncbi:MAG: hypothetical protein J4203_07560 [Candidatus Diapherotrites archaeon]|uniref:Uncharacterized protein n=1 Tax=Candidatus Iainarchaeum sp. TaxID=3101447 RepID=A0A8T4L913_9ARCH|nr:hypothetical protein [Candidatus Diapherotrites archaeon]